MAHNKGFKGQGIIHESRAEIKFLSRTNEYDFPVEIWLLNDAVNRNNWKFANIEKHLLDFVGRPILIAYVDDGDGIGDGHNFKTVKDPATGEERPSFVGATAERIVGTLSHFNEDFRVEKRDGNTWLVGKGVIWAWYAPELVDKMKNYALQGRSMEVSVEELVYENHTEGDVEVEDEYINLGTTILGDHVRPAVAGAKIISLQEFEESFRELKLRAASLREGKDSKEGVKKTVNYLSKRDLESLNKIIVGYTVLAAVRAENGINVALLCEDGTPATYKMNTATDTFAPEKVKKVEVVASFLFDGEDDGKVDVSVSDITDSLSAKLNKANADIEKANKDLLAANATISTMKTAESNRRIEAGKIKAKNVLSVFNQNRSEKIGDDVLTSLNSEIENGYFNDKVDEKGAWVGESAIEERVLAICARQVQEADQKAAAKQKNTFGWDKFNNSDKGDDGSIESLLSSWGV